jgi:hypothetical protein
MKVSPPILVRIEWADSQGRVTASWLAAHFNFAFVLKHRIGILAGRHRLASTRDFHDNLTLL